MELILDKKSPIKLMVERVEIVKKVPPSMASKLAPGTVVVRSSPKGVMLANRRTVSFQLGQRNTEFSHYQVKLKGKWVELR